MARRLKVFGITLGNFRHIVAASNQSEASLLVGCSLNHFRDYAAQTFNETEITVALNKPRTPFHRHIGDHFGLFKEGVA